MKKRKPTIRLVDFSFGEKIIHYSCLGIVIFFIGHMVLLPLSSFREFLFADFPNLYILGLNGLFIAASIRMNEAYTHDEIPLDENPDPKRIKDPSEIFLGSGPNYTMKSYNTLFFFAVLSFVGMMLFHLSLPPI